MYCKSVSIITNTTRISGVRRFYNSKFHVLGFGFVDPATHLNSPLHQEPRLTIPDDRNTRHV